MKNTHLRTEDTQQKVCSKCGILKGAAKFRKDKRRKSGLTSWCKECCNQYQKDNAKRLLAYGKQYRLDNPDKYRKWKLKSKYGMSIEDYDVQLESQGGICAICKQPPNGKQLCVDHDHTTGMIRGLLCVSCNTKLGWTETYQAEICDYIDRTARLQAEFSKDESLKPTTWYCWKVGAGVKTFVCDFQGHIIGLSDHEISNAGIVTPSVECPKPGCAFHEYIILAGWTPSG